MSNRHQRLTLRAETVRTLTATEAAGAAGGLPTGVCVPGTVLNCPTVLHGCVPTLPINFCVAVG